MTRLTLSAHITAADTQRRTLAGRIVTFNEEGNTSAGPVVFEAGSIEVPDATSVRLQLEHDHTKPLGRGLSFTEDEAGIDGVFKVANTATASDALLEASEGLRDGLSVGVDVSKSVSKNGVLFVKAAKLVEVSLVTFPAIESARVLDVAAAEAEANIEETQEVSEEKENMSETTEAAAPATAPVVEASATIAVPAPARTASRMPSLGEYVLAAASRDRNPDNFMRVTAALEEQVLSENPGIVPEPIVGPIVDTLLARRPFVSAVPNRAMPNGGKIFTRPKVTQHTSVGAQANELDLLSSQIMTIDPITVTKATYGGTLRVSVQDRDFTEPGILSLLVSDMVKQYANVTDNAAADVFTAAVTDEVALANNATADVVIKAIYDAAAAIEGDINELPDTIFASPDQWARLGSLADTSKRPVFPSLNPSNAAGSLNAASFAGNPLGLRLVVDANFASGTLIVGKSDLFECWEQAGGQLSVAAPSILAFDLAYYGYFAPVMLEASGFRKLKPAA